MTALTAACALLISGLSLKVTREGQTANRFANAVELLGSKNSETRIGAIYALSRLAVESTEDMPVVTTILTELVKSRAAQDADAEDYIESCRSSPAAPAEVGVALQVLFNDLAKKQRGHRINLERVCLTHIDLSGVDLSFANLNNSIIYRSRFLRATFADACLENANLVGNSFTSAIFHRASARGAVFGDAGPAISATMMYADFRDADLSGAMLHDITLKGADFSRTRLDAADLSMSDLTGARLKTDLTRVKGLPAKVRDSGTSESVAPFPKDLCSD